MKALPISPPLRVAVPIAFFLIGVFFVAGYYFSEKAILDSRLDRLARQELRTIAIFTAGEIESAHRNNRPQDVSAAIERAGSAPNMSAAALIDENRRIQVSANPALVGKPLNALFPAGSPTYAGAPLQGNDIDIIGDDATHRYTGYFPIQVRSQNQHFLPEQTAWLIASIDASAIARREQHSLLARSGVYAAVLLGFSLLCWWLFRQQLLLRVRKLSHATQAIANGDFSTDLEIGGHDELYDLSLDLQSMSDRLRENTEELLYLTHHDNLTSLLNRLGFEKSVDRACHHARTTDANFLLLYIDLDNFRIINDTKSHKAGDALLIAFANHVRHYFQDAEAIARLGGDAFAVLLPLTHTEDPRARANQFRHNTANAHFDIGEDTFKIHCSIGIAVIDARQIASRALSEADTACYAAKERGENRVQVWREDQRGLLERHGQMRWVSEINRALENDRFVLYAQPIAPLQHKSHGLHFEVLIRMTDEQGNIVPPNKFLPAAERFQLAGALDRWVIRHTFQALSKLDGAAAGLATCSINLSGFSLSDEHFITAIRSEFSRHPSVHPNQVCFEITETAAITRLHRAVQFIEQLHKIGCRFALDDFGSGLSSFGYLKNLPVDIIKIDGMFVRDLLTSPSDKIFTSAINQIAHEMGKKTIAEFAESTGIIDALKAMGIDYAQGYGIARPMPLDEVLSHYSKTSRSPLRRAANHLAGQMPHQT